MQRITADIIDAVKVQFLQPIFEDDFPERGMKAWLTKVEYKRTTQCYQLFFDFTEFEAENLKYFTEVFYPTRHTREAVQNGRMEHKELYTAIEAGSYTPKYSVYFSVTSFTEDPALFAEEIAEYLQVVE